MARRDFYGLPTIDENELLEFVIAYHCWRCPRCAGHRITHRCEKVINTFRCAAKDCQAPISRSEMEAIDRAEMRG
jgi:hypothetical protein